ncbi:MAG: putative ABC transporter permease [Coriobacteriales bacterium]|nr:putative ABC transporter permease [Coriobacteriales bacterium]
MFSTYAVGQRRPMGIPLRLVQVYYIVVLAVGLLYASFMDPASDLAYMYDLSMLRAIVQMGTSVQCVWMLERRFKLALPVCVISTLACMTLTAIDYIGFGVESPLFNALGHAGGVLLVLVEYVAACVVVGYLALGKKPHEVLVNPLNMKRGVDGDSWELPMRTRIRTWPFWRDIIIYFIVFSFLGHWAEMLFCRLIVLGVFMGGYDPTNAMLWDQWLFPFSAEGTALAMVVLVLYPLARKLRIRFKDKIGIAVGISFAVNMIVCTSIDFLTGMVANQHYELWDYRDMPFNFMGQVCLQNSLVYSIAATLIVWLLYPLMDKGMRRIPHDVGNMLFLGLVGFYAFEAALHFFNF